MKIKALVVTSFLKGMLGDYLLVKGEDVGGTDSISILFKRVGNKISAKRFLLEDGPFRTVEEVEIDFRLYERACLVVYELERLNSLPPDVISVIPEHSSGRPYSLTQTTVLHE